MACFLVPATEAAVTTIAEHIVRRGKKSIVRHRSLPVKRAERHRFSHKLKWLNNMLWGGSALLAFEHIWHGEVVPWFPFLTAAGNPEDAMAMLHEMATTGVTMAVLVTAVWAGMVAVSNVIEKRPVIGMKKGDLRMTLLTAAIAAIIATIVWYFKDGSNKMRIGTLSLMYWGATLMWLVDAVYEYIELKSSIFYTGTGGHAQ